MREAKIASLRETPRKSQMENCPPMRHPKGAEADLGVKKMKRIEIYFGPYPEIARKFAKEVKGEIEESKIFGSSVYSVRFDFINLIPEGLGCDEHDLDIRKEIAKKIIERIIWPALVELSKKFPPFQPENLVKAEETMHQILLDF